MNKNIKELFPDYIILIKVGTFIETYNGDAKILWIFDYKVRIIGENYLMCGFPKLSINKIQKVLEDLKINYMLVDKSHNYHEEAKVNFKGKNKYNEFLEKSTKKYAINERINNITSYLKEHTDKLKEVESLIYE